MRIDRSNINNYIKPVKIHVGRGIPDAPEPSEIPKIDDFIKKLKPVKTHEEILADREKKQADKREKMISDYTLLSQEMERVREYTDAAAESSKIQLKCMKIAMRIMAGDDVPEGDHRFLLEHAPELYGKAIMMRMQKEDPIKHKRLSDEDDFPDPLEEITGSSNSSSNSSPPAAPEIKISVNANVSIETSAATTE